MQSNRKTALIATLIGALCSIAGILTGFYIGVFKPLVATGAWKGIGMSKYVISAALILLVIVGMGLLARRALRRLLNSSAERNVW